MAMANSAQYGMVRTFRFTVGVACANGFFLIMGCLLQHFLQRVIPGVEGWMNLAIALYMVYLAWKMLGVHFEKEGTNGEDRLNSIKVGFFLQFLNPKLIMFCVAVSGGFLLPFFGEHILSLSAAITCLTFSALAANNMWALFGEAINRWLSRWQRVVNWVMAMLILWCAAQFIW